GWKQARRATAGGRQVIRFAGPDGPDGWSRSPSLPCSPRPAWRSRKFRHLVPPTYTASVLALTIAAGSSSGVAIVALMPVVWTALFHRRWESVCVVAAVIVSVIVFSLLPAAGPAPWIIRRGV